MPPDEAKAHLVRSWLRKAGHDLHVAEALIGWFKNSAGEETAAALGQGMF